MPTITFEGTPYDCSSDETVLDSLTRHGVLLPSGCKSGSCHSCKVKAVKGTPPESSQAGLKDTLKSQNYFLTCICKPTEELEIALADISDRFTGQVIEKKWLNKQVIKIKINRPDDFNYQAGQFINLIRNTDQLVRSYSLASIENDEFLELHIKRVPDGKMSNWTCDELQENDEISFFGPSGNCFYVPGKSEQPLLLAGTGTGLAPLYGIARDAIKAGHTGDIRLFHASLDAEGLYYEDELKELAANHPQLTYTPCVLKGETPTGGLSGEVDKAVVQALGSLTGYRVFICGDAPIVETMQRSFFFAGASMQEIYADAFAFTPEG
ncbi:MAG: FAD-binding oxidoreductase [Mariprofundaceae bacterium]